MATEVRHNPGRERYEITVDGELAGVADYRLDGDTFVFPHTEIHRSMRNRGLGAELVRGALDDVRHQGGTVVPRCWFVAQFIREHPEYADLLAA
ncbi:MAG: GNAT family N-acetyltransferase [Acidimicrobiia bacterium]